MLTEKVLIVEMGNQTWRLLIAPINDLKELKGRGTLDSAQHSDLT